jgi:hypothetical protein
MSINLKEIGWWFIAAVCVVQVYVSAWQIVNHTNGHRNERPAITQQ